MKYLLLVSWDAESQNATPDPTPAELAEHDDETFPWLDDLRERGKWVTGDMLAPPRKAAKVRKREGKAVITEGPFIETKEAIGGFDIIEADSMDEAVAIAAAHPVAEAGTIEVRPFFGG